MDAVLPLGTVVVVGPEDLPPPHVLRVTRSPRSRGGPPRWPRASSPWRPPPSGSPGPPCSRATCPDVAPWRRLRAAAGRRRRTWQG
ncbi:hypothetical protein QJS66_10985 [Kocuria rhizophila]|nr:hypothetical protein QJS66_10985 [Kocuria rhizophila]